jgi:antibiotic biosynthesis monooxygenase (ABM) superfamily enzyme
MWILILIAIFVVGGIIYKMGQTGNDSNRMVEGAAEGGCMLVALLQYFAIPLIIIGIIVWLVRSCN